MATLEENPRPERRPLRVMVIDDEDTLREAVKLGLEAKRMEVVCCASGGEAIARLREGCAPDVILLDLLMPGMDGWQFRVEQKREPTFAHIPVIVLSADHSAQAAAVDASAILTKPVDDRVLLDTVERVERELERSRMLARAAEQQRLISLGALLGGIAHEVNNPLSFVFGGLDLLHRQLLNLARAGEDGEPLALATALRALEGAREGAERVADIMRCASMFATADLHAIEIIDVHAVLESSIQVACNEIRHGAHLVRAYEDVPRVRGNPAKLGQVFLNLLLNAIYAIRDDGRRNHVIRVSTTVEDESVVFELTDSARKPAAQDGTARLHFGLEVSREVIEEMGGQLEVSPVDGAGLKFRVLLPAHSRVSYPAPAPKAPQRVPSGRPSVLVVDDAPLMCELLAAQLAEQYEVTSFTSPREALSALLVGDFDAILCDVMMPELNGTELYEEAVRSRPELRERFLFITGGAFAERVRLFLRQTGRPALRKPCRPEVLLEQLQRVVTRALN